MQIIFLPDWMMILSFFVLWPLLQIGAALIGRCLSDRFLSSRFFMFVTYGWEREGELYQSIFRIRAWKRHLPDGARVQKRGYRKKHLTEFSEQNLQKYIREANRAEFGHWLAIVPFFLFGLIAPPYIIPVMLGYALLVNLPCIIAQRYNRPRVKRVLHKVQKRRIDHEKETMDAS